MLYSQLEAFLNALKQLSIPANSTYETGYQDAMALAKEHLPDYDYYSLVKIQRPNKKGTYQTAIQDIISGVFQIQLLHDAYASSVSNTGGKKDEAQ